MSTIIDELGEKEQAIDFSKSEVKKIQQNIREGNIQNAYKLLMKGDDEAYLRDIFGNVTLEYYRKDCDLAANYWKMGHGHPLIVIIRDDISNDQSFYDYYGTDQEGFFKRVHYRDLLPMVLEADKYEKNEYLARFFQNWRNNHEVRDVWPTYANRLETVLAKHRGYPSWGTYLQSEMQKYGGRFAKLKGTNLLPVGNLALRGDAFEYHIERIARFKLLGLNSLVNQIEELLDKAVRDKVAVNSLDLEQAKTFTFAMFQLFGAHIFYSKGGVENMSISDMDRLNNSIQSWRGKKLPRLSSDIVEQSVASLGLPTATPKDYYLKNQQIAHDVISKENKIYYKYREEGKVSHDKLITAYEELEIASKEILTRDISSMEVENKAAKLEEALRELSEENKRAFSDQWFIINTGITIAATIAPWFLPAPISLPIAIFTAPIVNMGMERLKDYLIRRRTRRFSIPTHIWQYGFDGHQVIKRIMTLPLFG